MIDPTPIPIDPAFGAALDRFDVPPIDDAFIARLAHAPLTGQRSAPPTWQRPRLRGRLGWGRRTLIGIIAVGVASATAAANGLFGPIRFDVPTISKLFSPPPPPARAKQLRSIRAEPLKAPPAPRLAIPIAPIEAVQPPSRLPLPAERPESELDQGPRQPFRAKADNLPRPLPVIVRRRIIELPRVEAPKQDRRDTIRLADRPALRERAADVIGRRSEEDRPQRAVSVRPELPSSVLPVSPKGPDISGPVDNRADTLRELRQSRDLRDLRDLRSKRQTLRRLRKR